MATDVVWPKDTEMPCIPWVEILLHPEDYISPSLLPAELRLQSPDNMTSRDLFTMSAHIRHLQNTRSSSADTCGQTHFSFRTKDEIRAALQAQLAKNQAPLEIEEDDEAGGSATGDKNDENMQARLTKNQAPLEIEEDDEAGGSAASDKNDENMYVLHFCTTNGVLILF